MKCYVRDNYASTSRIPTQSVYFSLRFLFSNLVTCIIIIIKSKSRAY